MKAITFFKILNRKIKYYDKMATNPFTNPQPIVLIWVDKECEENENLNGSNGGFNDIFNR